MNTKRAISILVLGALLAGQALPAHAARMLCGMPKPAQTKSCGACASLGAVSRAVLSAGSCCRIAPAGESESATFVVSSPRRSASPDARADHLATVLSTVSVSIAKSLEAAALLRAPAHPSAPPPTAARTTVLRN